MRRRRRPVHPQLRPRSRDFQIRLHGSVQDSQRIRGYIPLCDEAKAYLDELHQSLPFKLIVTDIQSDPKLMERYATRIPLIIVNGREVVGYPPEKKWVKIAIKAGPRLDMR